LSYCGKLQTLQGHVPYLDEALRACYMLQAAVCM